MVLKEGERGGWVSDSHRTISSKRQMTEAVKFEAAWWKKPRCWLVMSTNEKVVCCSWAVWPNLAKFHHFGNILWIFVKCLWVYSEFGKCLNLHWQNVYVSGQPFKAVHSQILKNNKTIWSHCSWAPFVGSFSTHSRQCNLKPMSLTNFSLAMMKSITLIGCCRSSDYFLTNYAALFQHSIAMLCWNVLMTSTYVKTFKVVMNGIRTEPWMSVVGSNLWPIL